MAQESGSDSFKQSLTKLNGETGRLLARLENEIQWLRRNRSNEAAGITEELEPIVDEIRRALKGFGHQGQRAAG